MNEIIISGPSGAGKDTLIDMWIEKNPRIKRVITATTRAPRPNEEDGVHYHFYTHEEMQKRIDNGEFLEHMNVFGNIYGTPKSSVQNIVDNGDVAIIRIDVQGAIEVMPKMPDATTIFILPPSLEELRRRLVERGTDSQEKIEERMNTAVAEIICSQLYDCQIINDDRQVALQQLEDILNGQTYENTDLALSCLWTPQSEATHEKINSFLKLADAKLGMPERMLFKTKYGQHDVGVVFNERGRLKVVYTDPNKFGESFSLDYGSNGEMDVVTEFVVFLMKKSSKAVDE